MKALALLLLMAASNESAQPVASRPILIEISVDAQQNCVFKADGQPLSESALKEVLEKADKERPVHITSAEQTPWRCVAGAVFLVQNSGFGNVGFVSNPQPK